MTLTAVPTAPSSFDAWLEDRAATGAAPTHRAVVELRFEIELSAPERTPDQRIRDTLLAVISRFDRDALLERVDYERDLLLPGDARLVGASALVVPA